jgi:hydrocephalus-inducing protein
MVPVFFRIVGNETPIRLNISAVSIGPHVLFNRESITFGKIPVITDVVETLIISNDSDIDAEFRVYTNRKDQIFKLDVTEGIIPPRETFSVIVHALLRNETTFKDTLTIIVTDAPQEFQIPITATGVGDVVTSSLEDMGKIHFGVQYVGTLLKKEFILTNHGKLQQTLQWLPVKKSVYQTQQQISAQIDTDSILKSGAGLTKNKFSKLIKEKLDIPGLLPTAESLINIPTKGELRQDLSTTTTPIFTISPPRITLRPNQETVFSITGTSSRAGPILELLQCKVSQGRTSRVLYDTALMVDFTYPIFGIIPRDFKFLWNTVKNPDDVIQKQTLHLENICSCTVTANIQCSPPFSISSDEVTIEPYESTEVTLIFDGCYKKDQQSRLYKDQGRIVYANHSRMDYFTISGHVLYPNLNFSSTRIDFGCVMSDTKKTVVLTCLCVIFFFNFMVILISNKY